MALRPPEWLPAEGEEPSKLNPNYTKVLATQAGLIATAMSTATKIDENNLRRQSGDKLDQLLEMARAKRAELQG